MQAQQKHGVPNQLNVCVLDKDSIITHHGAHARVVGNFMPQGNELYCRVDMLEGRREPTPVEVLDVAREVQGLKGRWQFREKEYWNNPRSGNECIDIYFDRVPNGRRP